MVSIDVLMKVRDALYEELVKPGDTGFWGVGIGKDEVILYYDKSKAKRHVVVANAYSYGNESIGVRVIESSMPTIMPGNFRKQAAKAFEGIPPCFVKPDRPLESGSSVCDCQLTACSSTGPFIDLDTGEVVWVTCAHCTLFSSDCDGEQSVIGRPMSQPSPLDGGVCPQDVIGVTYKATPNFWVNEPATTDTVAIKLNPGIQVSNYICGTREMLGKAIYLSGRYRVPNVGDTICKAGRTSGITCGTVQAIGVKAMVDYGCFTREVDNVIAAAAVVQQNDKYHLYSGEGPQYVEEPLLEPGDSGSIGFDPDTGDFLGQGFASSSTLSLFISPEEIHKVLHLVPFSALTQPKPKPSQPTPRPQPSSFRRIICRIICPIINILGICGIANILGCSCMCQDD